MKAERLRKLRAAGWKAGNARDFLKLSDEEAMLVELKLSLADALKLTRKKRGMSQLELAERMGSSQSRVAKIEAGDASVSFDLIIRAFLAAGASRVEAAFHLGCEAALDFDGPRGALGPGQEQVDLGTATAAVEMALP